MIDLFQFQSACRLSLTKYSSGQTSNKAFRGDSIEMVELQKKTVVNSPLFGQEYANDG